MKHDKNTFNHDGGSVQVHDLDDGLFAINVWEIGQSVPRQAVLPHTDAPALMQAIGDCLPPIPATVRDGSYEACMAVALEYLGKAVRALEAETAEAKEQAKLEAEALELYNVCMTGHSLSSFNGLGGALRDQWLAVARRAREMRAEK